MFQISLGTTTFFVKFFIEGLQTCFNCIDVDLHLRKLVLCFANIIIVICKKLQTLQHKAKDKYLQHSETCSSYNSGWNL